MSETKTSDIPSFPDESGNAAAEVIFNSAATAQWSGVLANQFHALCLATALGATTALTDRRNTFSPADWRSFVTCQDVKNDVYKVKLFLELQRHRDYHYEPGFNNPLSQIVERELTTNVTAFVAFLSEVLRSSRLSEDVRLELLSASSKFATAANKSQLAHLARGLLAQEPESVLDTAAIALSRSRLCDRGAAPLLRRAATRTNKVFLKKQLQQTADELDDGSHHEAPAQAR